MFTVVLKGLPKLERRVKALRREIITAVEDGITEAEQIVATEAKLQLEGKGLDPDGTMAQGVKTETTRQGGTVVGTVGSTSPDAYEKEMGPEGGFLFVAGELSKDAIRQAVVRRLKRVVH